MLNFYYESGNDQVAVSQRNVKNKVKEYIQLYKENPKENNNYLISQVDMINAIGSAIFDGKIKYSEVSIVVGELNKQFLFDREGVLNESWYEAIPCFDY